MEENTPLEQFLELDEEQLQAITGGARPEELEAAIAQHRAKATSYFTSHENHLAAGRTNDALDALNKFKEYTDKANSMQKSLDIYKDMTAVTAIPGKKLFGCCSSSSTSTYNSHIKK